MLNHYRRYISKPGRLVYILFIFFVCFFSVSKAQFTENEELQDEQVQSAFLHTVETYDKRLSRNAMVYTGRSYYDGNHNIQGHQFFIEDYWEQGNINFKGNVYDSIYIKYDIYRDLLLIENFNSDGYLSPIILYGPEVAWFDLMDHYFVRLERDTDSNFKEGYYNQMYKGKTLEVLVKRRKEIVNSSSINSISEIFNQKDRYYIKKDDLYHQVRKRKSVLKVLESHKREVKSFIKRNSILFKENADVELAAIAEYYESLMNN